MPVATAITFLSAPGQLHAHVRRRACRRGTSACSTPAAPPPRPPPLVDAATIAVGCPRGHLQRRSSVPRSPLRPPRELVLHHGRHQRQRLALDALRGHDQDRVARHRIAAGASRPRADTCDGVTKTTSSAPRSAPGSEASAFPRVDGHAGKKAGVLVARVHLRPRRRPRRPRAGLVALPREQVRERRTPGAGADDRAAHQVACLRPNGAPRRRRSRPRFDRCAQTHEGTHLANRCSSPRRSRPMFGGAPRTRRCDDTPREARRRPRRRDEHRQHEARQRASETIQSHRTTAKSRAEQAVGDERSARKTPHGGRDSLASPCRSEEDGAHVANDRRDPAQRSPAHRCVVPA